MKADALSLFLNKESTLLFFGSGEVCEKMIRWFSNHNYQLPLAIIDNNKEKIGRKQNGIPIVSLETAFSTYENISVLITSSKYGEEMEKQLSPFVKKEKILSLSQKRIHDYFKNLEVSQYEEALKDWYYFHSGEVLNLEHPKTFNEKIQWLKLYDSTPLKTRLADKYLVREWIKEQIGEEYLIPLLGVWDSFDEIDFDALPEKFALKTNHGCGWNYIVTDKSKMNLSKMKEDFDLWMKMNFAFCCGLELHYKDIVPKIIAEEYIQNMDDLVDYKFFCFDGRVELIRVSSKRKIELHNTHYTRDWDLTPVTSEGRPQQADFEIPSQGKKMVELLEKLAKPFCHVRVDIYEIGGKIQFGEMTFTSESGLNRLHPSEIEYELGSKLVFPPIKGV